MDIAPRATEERRGIRGKIPSLAGSTTRASLEACIGFWAFVSFLFGIIALGSAHWVNTRGIPNYGLNIGLLHFVQCTTIGCQRYNTKQMPEMLPGGITYRRAGIAGFILLLLGSLCLLAASIYYCMAALGSMIRGLTAWESNLGLHSVASCLLTTGTILNIVAWAQWIGAVPRHGPYMYLGYSSALAIISGILPLLLLCCDYCVIGSKYRARKEGLV